MEEEKERILLIPITGKRYTFPVKRTLIML